MGQAEPLQGGRGEARLEPLLADQDELLIPAGDGGVPPWARGIAAPLQRVAGQQDGAGDQPAGPPLVVASDVDEQGAVRPRSERLGGRGRRGSKALASISCSSAVLGVMAGFSPLDRR